MTIIHSVGRIEIKNIGNEEYSITSDPYLFSFFSLYKIKTKREKSDIIFKCSSIEPLSEFIKNSEDKKISYDSLIKLIYDVGFTIKSLEQTEKAILCFSLDDIIVIDKHIFFFVNTSKILPIIKQQITLKVPIDIKSSFLTPGINWKGLPIKTHYKTGIYSFALMAMYAFTNSSYSPESLNPIFNTKLYYFILRCLKDNPEERSFFYI